MSTKVNYISIKDYKLNNILDDEIECVEEILDKSGYLCDAISETADSYIPTYNIDVWNNASDISDYIEEAIAQGIAPIEGNNINLIGILQAGYYQYYTELLYDNLDELAFNYVAEKINEYLSILEDTNDIDVDEIENEIDSSTTNYDNNNSFSDLEDLAQNLIERINSKDFNL